MFYKRECVRYVPSEKNHAWCVHFAHSQSHCMLLVITLLPLPLLPLLVLLLHLFNGLFYRTTSVSRYQKDKTSLDLNEARDDGVWNALASAGPYANNLHLAPDR